MTRLASLAQAYGMIAPTAGQQLSMFAEPSPAGRTAPAGEPGPAGGERELEVIIVNTPQALRELEACLASAQIIAFDTETTSTDQMSAELVGIALATEPGRGYYLPVGHAPGSGDQLALEQVLNALRPHLTNPDIPKAGHNLKYDYVVLARYGLRVRHWHSTQ